MNNTIRDEGSLPALLTAELIGYEELLSLVDQEWECLKRRDVNGLIALTRKKEGRIREVESVRRQIREWLSANGADAENPEGTFSGPAGGRKGDGLKAAALSEATRSLRSELRSRNDRNKRYIEETLKIIEHFFSLLALPEDKPPVYMRGYENGGSRTGSRSLISRRL